MNKARLIVKEIRIEKQGEINFFEIRLPKNVKRIIGIETDVFILSPYTLPSNTISGTWVQYTNQPPVFIRTDGSTGEVQINRSPVLKWDASFNPTIGKLRLQGLDKVGIFFEAWVALMLLNGGIPDMSFGLFPKSPYSINTKPFPKKINYPCAFRTIEGMYEDNFGKNLNQDMSYLIKVFVWIETDEVSSGLAFDFQVKENVSEGETRNELQIKI